MTAAAALGISAFVVPSASAEPEPVASAATPAEIQAAVQRGADFLESQQAPDGRILDFGGDWALSSLAAAGRDVDAIRATPDGPSALGAYRTLWTSGPEGEEDWTTPSGPVESPVRPSSDFSKALMISRAIGLEPTRLSVDQNLVAQLAGVYRGRQTAGETPGVGRIEGSFGNPTAMSGTVGSLFALSRMAVPQVLLDTIADTVRSNQLDNGAWSWDRIAAPSERAEAWRSDTDMTAQAIAALCDVGVRPSDPTIERGISYLRGNQIPNGSFAGQWSPDGDTNSAAVVTLALNACGIDPHGADWTTSAGNSPIDYLLTQQLPSGAFDWATGGQDDNLYATQEAVRALTGSGYVAEPTRTIASPKVADGTVVPQALVIDAGIDETGERDLRVCRVSAPVGATVAELLQAAATSAQPAGCVTGLNVQDGAVRALNGVAGDSPQRTWLARVEGGAARQAGVQPVCHGQIVSLYVGRTADASSTEAAPCTAKDDVPVDPTPQPPSPAQPTAPAPVVAPQVSPAPVKTAEPPAMRLTLGGRKDARGTVRVDRKGRVRITLRCPKGAAARGCWSVIDARAKFRTTPRGEARNRRVGGRTVRTGAGKSRTVTVTLSSALRRDLRRVGSRSIRFVVRTHGDDARTTSRTTASVKVRPAAMRR